MLRPSDGMIDGLDDRAVVAPERELDRAVRALVRPLVLERRGARDARSSFARSDFDRFVIEAKSGASLSYIHAQT